MADIETLRQEAFEALDIVWFVQSVEEINRTDITLSLRLHIRKNLFVQIFWGEKSRSLFLALVEGNRRIFGIDQECGAWHLHPFGFPTEHKPLPEGLGPRPILSFLSKVEELLLTKDLL